MAAKATPIKGRRDPNVPGCLLVRSHPSFPELRRVPDNTLYRYNTKDKHIECMVTIMPDDNVVAWELCAGCSSHVSRCGCKYGIIAGRAIDVIHDKTVAVMAGAKWENVEVARRSYSLPGTLNDTIPLDKHGKPPTKRIKFSARPTTTPTPTKRLRLNGAKPLRMSDIDSTAEQLERTLTKKLVKHLSSTGTTEKRIRKTQPQQGKRLRKL